MRAGPENRISICLSPKVCYEIWASGQTTSAVTPMLMSDTLSATPCQGLTGMFAAPGSGRTSFRRPTAGPRLPRTGLER